MAFTVPTFPLMCNIWRGAGIVWPLGPPDVTSIANLAFGKRVVSVNDFRADEDAFNILLLVPALTDVRDLSCSTVTDVVEVPAGSGRWYQALCVDDIGKGFPNEHRAAALLKISQVMTPFFSNVPQWPAPIP
jgi:hypothetical protein